MSQDRKRIDIDGDKEEDRLSTLPREVVDSILALLPALDAARTCILSKKWRYIWSELPYLALNRRFCFDIEYELFFQEKVDFILMVHRGDIIKFDLYIPRTNIVMGMYGRRILHNNIDKWLLKVTRHGLKELILTNVDDRIYELPCYVFRCTTLTHLELNNCVFLPPSSFLGFPKLEALHLEEVAIKSTTESCVLNVPCLVKLVLLNCDRTEYLNISSPLLEILSVHDFHHLVLNCFFNCKKLRDLRLGFNYVVDLKHPERATLEKLFVSLAPALGKLELNLNILTLLSADTIPLYLLNSLWFLKVNVHFDKLRPTSGLLQLIQSLPNLTELEIFVNRPDYVSDAEADMKYLSIPVCLDQPLDKLKYVVIHLFEGSETEMLFIKLLLTLTPSLLRMRIVQGPFETREERIITRVDKFS